MLQEEKLKIDEDVKNQIEDMQKKYSEKENEIIEKIITDIKKGN